MDAAEIWDEGRGKRAGKKERARRMRGRDLGWGRKSEDEIER